MAFVLGNPASIPANSLVVINVKSSHCAIFGKFASAYQEFSGDWRVVLSWSVEFADNFLYLSGTSRNYPLEAPEYVSPANPVQIEIFENALGQGGSYIFYNSSLVALEHIPVRLPVGTQYWYIAYKGGTNSIYSAVESNSSIDFERFEAGNYFEFRNHPYIEEYAASISDAIQPFRSQYTPTRLPVGTQYWHIGYRGGLNSILSGTEFNSAIDLERFEAINYFHSNNHPIIHDYALAIQNANLNFRNCKLGGRITLDDYYYNSIFPASPSLQLDRYSDCKDWNEEDMSLEVTANCVWDAVSNVPWIIVQTPSGTNSGIINFFVTENISENERVGTITVYAPGDADKVYTVTQLGYPVE